MLGRIPKNKSGELYNKQQQKKISYTQLNPISGHLTINTGNLTLNSAQYAINNAYLTLNSLN